MLEFKYSKWSKVGLTFFLILLIVVFIACIFMPYYNNKLPFNSIYIIAPISFGLILLCCLGIKDLFVAKVIITDTYISAKNALFDRKLRVNEIKGFKKVEKYILIYPKGNLKKRIKISDYLKESSSIHYWLYNNFKDLNIDEGEKEEKEFYKSSEYGISLKEKENLLRSAHKIAKWLKICSISITILCLFLVKYLGNQNFVYPLVFIPSIIILIVLYFKGIIKYDEKKEDEKTIYPSVLWSFLTPVFGLLLYVMFSINILKYDLIWNILIYSTLIVFFLCVYGSKEYKFENAKAIGTTISLFLFSGLYCFSVIIIVNVFFDDSEEELYQAPITEKRVVKGKTTSYYFTLNNNKLSDEPRDFDVTKTVFDSKRIGDSVDVSVKSGRLGIPYYKID